MLARIKKSPEPLQSALMQSFTIKRFSSYKKGIFKDSTGHHIFRCVDIVDQLPKGGFDRKKVRTYILIHDLPEIITTDYTAIEKEDHKLSKNFIVAEEKAARRIFTENYLRLFQEFNDAGRVLNGDKSTQHPPPEAFIAKVVDSYENDSYFHKVLSKWFISEGFSSEKIPSEQALSYTFRHTPIQLENVNNSNYSRKVKQLCLLILAKKLKLIQESWDRVPEKMIPKSIIEGLNSNVSMLLKYGRLN